MSSTCRDSKKKKKILLITLTIMCLLSYVFPFRLTGRGQCTWFQLIAFSTLFRTNSFPPSVTMDRDCKSCTYSHSRFVLSSLCKSSFCHLLWKSPGAKVYIWFTYCRPYTFLFTNQSLDITISTFADETLCFKATEILI